jgi:peptidoglycan/xylan/chitin deacetylase (PgdA/CDA1 family)
MKRALLAATLLWSAAALGEPQVAVTFDDLPAHGVLPAGMTRVEIAQQVIAAAKQAGLPPVPGLINASLIKAEPAAEPVLKLWREAGFPLGNHTFSHPNLASMTAQAFEADVTKNEPVLQAHSGDWHWFRYPFLSEGDTPEKRSAVRTWLASRGYRIAPANVIVGDWNYPEPYARCLAKQDKAGIARLETLYLKAAGDGLAYARAASATLNGRDVPYVLLLHVGAFQAHMLPQLVSLYRAKGVRFVSLDSAEADPYYKAYVDPSLPAPPGDFGSALRGQGKPVPSAPADPSAELAAICQ